MDLAPKFREAHAFLLSERGKLQAAFSQEDGRDKSAGAFAMSFEPAENVATERIPEKQGETVVEPEDDGLQLAWTENQIFPDLAAELESYGLVGRLLIKI